MKLTRKKGEVRLGKEIGYNKQSKSIEELKQEIRQAIPEGAKKVMIIDKELIKTRLQELAGNLNVKITTHRHLRGSEILTRAVSARITDEGYAFNFNPSKIRSDSSLEKRVQFCAGCIDSIGGI